MLSWSCHFVSWLCFLLSWLHCQAECPHGWQRWSLGAPGSHPAHLAIAAEGEYLVPNGSDKSLGHDLVRRAEVSSVDLVWGEGISRQCSVERWIWTSRSLIRQITGLFSKTLLFSWMPFLYTHHQPNTLTIMIPICSLTQWHKWYLLFYALVILRLLRKCQKKKKKIPHVV